MERKTRAILGKRGRSKQLLEEAEAGALTTQLKRSRTSDVEEDENNAHSKPRRGLLTGSLAESQVAPATAGHGPEQGFPFMKLPAELRIHVYCMALSRNEPLHLHVERAPEKSDENSVNNLLSSVRPGSREYSALAATERIMGAPSSDPNRTPMKDPILPVMLRLNKRIYNEARPVLYSDNVFDLSLTSGIHTLSTLHQRSRSLIKSVILTIPSHHDILDGFADLVRLGLRYCWGLKLFKIILQADLPDDGPRMSGTMTIYANAFHILRWLPKGCSVVLEGCVSESVMRVVKEEGRLQGVLDEVSEQEEIGNLIKEKSIANVRGRQAI